MTCLMSTSCPIKKEIAMSFTSLCLKQLPTCLLPQFISKQHSVAFPISHSCAGKTESYKRDSSHVVLVPGLEASIANQLPEPLQEKEHCLYVPIDCILPTWMRPVQKLRGGEPKEDGTTCSTRDKQSGETRTPTPISASASLMRSTTSSGT